MQKKLMFFWSLTVLFIQVDAYGEVLEELLLVPGGVFIPRHFVENPAHYRFNGIEASTSGARVAKTASLDQRGSQAASPQAQTIEDHVGAAIMADLGAGAAVGLSHQSMYRKTTISQQNSINSSIVELLKESQSALRIVIEFIERLNVGMTVRYLFQDYQIVGAQSASQTLATFYRVGFIGYGAGIAYDAGSYGISYAYTPPLRGKTTIMGEEYIVVERGRIILDAYTSITHKLGLSLLLKRWINELDDRAEGTTASNDNTEVSLLGLDPDQYLWTKQLLMAGVDVGLSPKTSVRFGLGREEAELNFSDYRPRILRTNQGLPTENDPQLKYYRVRAAIRFSDAGLELGAGGGFFKREHEFSEDVSLTKYKSIGRELFATIGMKL